MLIKKVTLKNFRQYREEQMIKFAIDKEKNVTMIYGEAGCGKTNLFSAINWCLYGELGGVEGESEIVNKAALSEALDGGGVETVVKVEFSHGGNRYHCIRTLTAENVHLSGDNDGTERFEYLSKHEPYLCTIRSTGGDCERDDDPTGTIHSILPSEMRRYFFFDGEKIDELSKPGHEKEVRKSIDTVVQLDILRSAIKHLVKVCKWYNDELKKHSSGELNELVNEKSKKTDEKDRLEIKQSELEIECSAAEKLKDAYDDQLRNSREIEGQVKQRDNLKIRSEYLDSELKNNETEMKKVATKAFIVLSREICNRADEIIGRKRKTGLPSGIRATFLRDLLNERICICGRHIEPDSPEEMAIKRLSDTKLEKAEDLIINLMADLRNLSAETDGIVNDLKRLHREKGKIEEELEKIDEEREDISESIGSCANEDTSKLESKRIETEDRLVRIKIGIDQTSRDIHNLENELNALNGKIDAAESKEKKGEELKKKSGIAEKSRIVLGKIDDRFAQEMRSEIQDCSQKIFHSLIWKNSQFKDVILSEDFELEVLDRWGTPARRELSASERECFSLAFILAMAKVTKIEAPFIMDTPVAKMSEVPSRNFSENLPKLTKQLVLLITKKEFPAYCSANINSKVGREYNLHFDDITGCTTIEEEGS